MENALIIDGQRIGKSAVRIEPVFVTEDPDILVGVSLPDSGPGIVFGLRKSHIEALISAALAGVADRTRTATNGTGLKKREGQRRLASRFGAAAAFGEKKKDRHSKGTTEPTAHFSLSHAVAKQAGLDVGDQVMLQDAGSGWLLIARSPKNAPRHQRYRVGGKEAGTKVIQIGAAGLPPSIVDGMRGKNLMRKMQVVPFRVTPEGITVNVTAITATWG